MISLSSIALLALIAAIPTVSAGVLAYFAGKNAGTKAANSANEKKS